MVALSQLTNVHSLADFLDQGHVLPVHEAVEMIRQVAVAVAALHRAGTFHGRMSPTAIVLDGKMRATLSSRRNEAAPDQSGFCSEWIPQGVRDQAFARLMDRLEGKPPARDVYSSQPSSPAGGDWNDSRQIDVYGLAAILCRLITAKSADAYLRSPRVKGSVPEWLQRLFERALGGGSPRLRDADDFLAALEPPSTCSLTNSGSTVPESSAALSAHVEAPPAERVLEVFDPSPSCLSGIACDGPEGGRREARPEDAALPFQKLGHYEIVSRLGQGGMGEVYLGYESSLDRRVAIKVLPADLARDPDLVRRFRSEATAAARLIHPNIIQIYYIGEDAGHQFFAMQHVDGLSLAQFLQRGQRPTMEQSLAIIEETLSGLVAAHRQGLVHRDIKPGNILLDRVHRRALLADFGLVKSLEDTAATRTSKGAVLGTADYISPEQGLGNAVDFRSDLYSLGVVLYQLLCGRLPFIGKEFTAVIYQHVHEALPHVCDVEPSVPRELAAIVEKLLAKSPDGRYQTAADVLADLRAFRAGQPLPAGGARPGSGYPTAAPAESGLPARLIDTFPAVDQPTLPGRAPPSAASAGPSRPVSRRRALLTLAGAAALPAAAIGMWFGLVPSEKRARWLSGLTLPAGKEAGEIRQFGDHPSEVNGFVVTPDEEFLLVGDRTGKLHVWDFRMGEKRRTIRAHGGPIRRLILSRDGKFLITASADQTLKMWNIATWKPVTQFNGHVEIVSSVTQVPGREEIVSSSFDGTLIRWQMAQGGPLARYGSVLNENSVPDATAVDFQTLDRHITWIRDVVIPEPGHRILSAGNEGAILVWDLESASVTDRLLGNSGIVMCLALSPDGTRLLAGGYKKVLCLWDLTKNELIRRMPHDSATPACVAFSPNGRLALSGGADGVIHVWDVESGRERHQLEGHEGSVTSIRFLADGRRIVSSGEDRSIRVWKLPADSL